MKCPACNCEMEDYEDGHVCYVQDGDVITAIYHFYCRRCAKRLVYKEWFRMANYGFENEN